MDIKVIEFNKSKNTVSIFNSDDAARRVEGVYTINKVASKREVLLISKDNNIEKYNILSADI